MRTEITLTVDDTLSVVGRPLQRRRSDALWSKEASAVTRAGIGQTGLWLVGRELLRGVLVDESLVQEPIDGATLGSDVTEGVPERDQLA